MRSLKANIYPVMLFLVAALFVVLAFTDGLSVYQAVKGHPGGVDYAPTRPAIAIPLYLAAGAMAFTEACNEIRARQQKPSLGFFQRIGSCAHRVTRFIRTRLGLDKD